MRASDEIAYGRAVVIGIALAVCGNASGWGAETIPEALLEGAPYAHVRYRFEFADQQGFDKDARASTLSTRLGYRTGEYLGFSAYGELEDVRAIGNDLFNSTVNGRIDRPVVRDPEDFVQLNQAYLQYRHPPELEVRVGRQVVYFDNQRFVSEDPFRQNQQTFDSLRLSGSPLPDATLDYVYVHKARRSLGEESPVGTFPMTSHLLHAEYAGLAFGQLSAYAYLLDFERDLDRTLSSATLGARFSGDRPMVENLSLLYAAEYARQIDFADNPEDFGLDYFAGELGAAYGGVSAKLGYESLGGDGTNGLRAPLGTAHAFFGWADQVLPTPATGATDLYVEAHADVASVTLTLVYHNMDAEEGGADLGHEWDARVARTFYERLTAEVIYANYVSDGFAVDTEKLWFALTFKY